MAALTKNRNTSELGDDGRFVNLPVAAATTIYIGSIVALNAAGYAVPADANILLTIVGRMERVKDGIPGQQAINISGADCPPNPPNLGAAGAISVDVRRRGPFNVDLLTADAITFANVLQPVYMVDDHTVSISSATGVRPRAGRLIQLSVNNPGTGWVDFTDKNP